MGRVSCNILTMIIFATSLSGFVPCGACELQSSDGDLHDITVHDVSSPVGRVSCNLADMNKTLDALEFRPLWGA